MSEKKKQKLSDEKMKKVSGGGEEEIEVWTWFQCFRPNCQYEFKVRGKIPKDTLYMCQCCYQDSAKSTGIYEEQIIG